MRAKKLNTFRTFGMGSREWGRGGSAFPSTPAAESPVVRPATTSPRLATKSRIERFRVSKTFAQDPTAAEAKPSSRRFMSKNPRSAGRDHDLISREMPHRVRCGFGPAERPVDHAESPIPSPATSCPPSSQLGTARAESPLLAQPLEGPVYLRASSHKLPDLVAALHGQIDINLDGRVDSVNSRLRTSFATVPDAPVSKFTLSLDGGNKGLLQNSANLCKAPLRLNVKMAGQNGKTTNENPLLATPCGQKERKANKKAGAHR